MASLTSDSQNIAVIGAGISGAYLAVLLGRQGRRVLLFDPKSPWEGSYGAGIVDASFLRNPDLEEFEGSLPIPSLRVLSPGGREFLWTESQLVRGCSRGDLADFLLKQAREAGASIPGAKIETIEKRDGVWHLRTGEGDFEARFLVGADGGSSFIRKVLNLAQSAQRITLEVSYTIPQRWGDQTLIRFLDDLSGTFWFSPRPRGSAAGLWASGRFLQARDLFDRLDRLLEQLLQIPVSKEITRSVAHISLFERFEPLSLAGEDWALIGDAAGLVDPMTADGVVYGIRSASLLADNLKEPAFTPTSYMRGLRKGPISILKKRARLNRFLTRLRLREWLVRGAIKHDRLRRLLLSSVFVPPLDD